MKLYDNGEPILKDRLEDEEWYGYYQNLIEITIAPEFTFSTIEDPYQLVELFNIEWTGYKHLKHYQESFPTEEQILRWSVLLAERHNNAYMSPKIIEAYRDEYAELKKTLSDWTDWDVAMLEVALLGQKTGNKEFFRDIKKGGLPENKFWIYDNHNPLAKYTGHLIQGLTTLGIFELHEYELQWRWSNKE